MAAAQGKNRTVADIMSQPVVTATADETVADAAARMREQGVGSVVVGDVRGLEGFYHYRQYDAVELAETRTLEDVWYLLYHGELPSLAQRRQFIDELRPLREIPADVLAVLPAIVATAPDAPPLDVLR